jgi:hypothetical protein
MWSLKLSGQQCYARLTTHTAPAMYGWQKSVDLFFSFFLNTKKLLDDVCALSVLADLGIIGVSVLAN